jgi:hypothetical protein
MSFDPTMQAIMDTIADNAAGREGKRTRFAEIWADFGDDADPIHRCILAHYMADVQDEPAEALLWDQRALDAARGMDEDEFAATLPGLVLESFFPSLHLNLAQDYDRLSRPEDARRHLALARESFDDLPEDGYGQMIRGGVARLEEKLGRG